MALLPPRVVGPLSECSSGVKVEGQLTGADVRVYADGSLVGTATAVGPSQIVTLTAALSAGAKVTATQTIGVESSIQSPDPVVVQAKPPAIPPVAFRTPIYQCGECLWLEGAVPGAHVEVHGNGGLRGSGDSYDGNARLHLNMPIAAGEILRSRQEACGDGGPDMPGPSPQLPVGEDQRRRLPKPVVGAPLRECQKGVVVSNIIPGATVILHRSAGPNLQACFDETSLRFTVNPGLVDGETITAEQFFLNCEAFSDMSDPVSVGPAEPVPPPQVQGPICVGATSIRLHNVLYGSRIRILYGGAEIGIAEAPEEGTYDFPIPPLAAPGHHGGSITAQQELCGHWSVESAPVAVHTVPEDLPRPEIAEPLFECAAAVHVRNLQPGARVYVISDMLGAPIGEMQVFADEATVPVAPLLMPGDHISAYQVGCGKQSDSSDPVEVQPLPEQLEPPSVKAPLYSCNTAVIVLDAVPGARVDVFVNGVIRGTALAGAGETSVPLAGGLQVGDYVQARQRICDRVTEPGRGVRVERFDGRWITVGDANKAEILAVHAALLRTGKILYFGGDQHTGELNTSGDVDHTRLFDCNTYAVSPVTGLPASADLFCAGHAQLPDGRILVGGGTHDWPGGVAPDPHGHGPSSHFTGSREAWIFDPADEQWHRTDELMTQRPSDPTLDLDGGSIEATGGKWYPTLLTLPNGRVMAVSGHPRELDSRHNNNTLERYNPATGLWEYIGDSDCSLIPRGVGRTLEYPRMFVLPDNTVLCVSQLVDGTLSQWRIGNDANDWASVTTPRAGYGGNPLSHTAVLLPLRPGNEYTARVLLCGESTAYVLTPRNASPWTTTVRKLYNHPAPGDTNPRRENLDAVILPTGEVFVEGGAKNGSSDATGVKKAEMFDPEDTSDTAVGTWRVLPAAQEVRNYHSVALLLPNGAVWVAGSNIDSKTGLGNRNLWIEIFEPWYFCHPRPRIEAAPTAVCNGDTFTIVTPNAGQITQVVMVRCGTATHNFNPDQRLIELAFEYDPADRLQVQAPPHNAIAPPGYYLIFVLNGQRVPSAGVFVRLCRRRRSIVTVPEWWELILRRYLRDLAPADPGPLEDLIAAMRAPLPPQLARALKQDAFDFEPDDADQADQARARDQLQHLNTSITTLSADIDKLRKKVKKLGKQRK